MHETTDVFGNDSKFEKGKIEVPHNFHVTPLLFHIGMNKCGV